MREREKRVARTVIAGAGVLSRNAGKVPEVAALARRLARHAGRIDELIPEELIATRHQSSNEANRIASLKDGLREKHLKRIARAGRKLMKKVPGVARAFRVPPKSAPAEKLVASARTMLKAIRPARKLFIEAGFARDFEKACAADTATLATIARETGPARTRGARLRREMSNETREGRALIEVIDAVLQPRIAEDLEFRLDWQRATRVGPRIGRPPEPRGKRPPPAAPTSD